MSIREQAYSKGEWAALLVTRVLIAALLTALLGAVENWFYERFFAPELYAVGPPLGRAIWLAAFSFPFILVGLLLLGLPIAYLLHRWRVESAPFYALLGMASGGVWGSLIGFQTNYGFAVSAFYGCSCALFWWRLRPKR
jgi:hypothetical protein